MSDLKDVGFVGLTTATAQEKGDWYVGIIIDIIEYARRSDIIVLASGDSDFDILIHKIRSLYDNNT